MHTSRKGGIIYQFGGEYTSVFTVPDLQSKNPKGAVTMEVCLYPSSQTFARLKILQRFLHSLPQSMVQELLGTGVDVSRREAALDELMKSYPPPIFDNSFNQLYQMDQSEGRLAITTSVVLVGGLDLILENGHLLIFYERGQPIFAYSRNGGMPPKKIDRETLGGLDAEIRKAYAEPLSGVIIPIASHATGIHTLVTLKPAEVLGLNGTALK